MISDPLVIVECDECGLEVEVPWKNSVAEVERIVRSRGWQVDEKILCMRCKEAKEETV